MLNVLLWLVAVEAIGLIAFPLCYYLLPRLKDRGFAVSKPLGILLLAYLSWILSVLHILPSLQLTVLAICIVLGSVSVWSAWKHRRELLEFVLRERVTLLVSEGIFLAVFVAWVVYRAYDPSISHTEQPMDFAFLNASIRSDLGPPEDPWLRGHAVSYYYFGYWMMGTLSKLTGITSNISYNLSLALVPAMSAIGIFGLVAGLVRANSGPLRHAVAGGIMAAMLLTVAANLEGVLEFMRANDMGPGLLERTGIDGLDEPISNLTDSWRPEEFYWWWRATRVISDFDGDQLVDYTIHEFPFFSFILGDLHPHVMSIPFVILFLTVCWDFFRYPFHLWKHFHFRPYATVLLLGAALGGLAFTNMWDLPVFSAFLLGVALLKAYSVRGGNLWSVLAQGATVWAAATIVALLLILPYLLTFTSQVSGIGAVVDGTTRPLHMFIVWALLLVAVIPLVLGLFWRTTVRADWARLSIVALLIGFIPYVVWAFLYLEQGGATTELVSRLAHVLPFALLISIGVYTSVWVVTGSDSSPATAFALCLGTLGLLLIMGPELLHVDDSFGGAHERMNTVFKLYYQAWVVLAAASGFAFHYWASLRETVLGWRLRLTYAWSAAFVLLLAGSLYYPLAAAATKGDLFHDGPTLDGLAFVAQSDKGEYRAIEKVREVVGKDSAVLEAVGGDYSAYGRISASTGAATVLGWPGHEVQWRGSADLFAGREEDVATIYQTLDQGEAKALLAKYRVDYVYVGQREREEYGAEGLAKFPAFMEVVYDQDGAALYRIRGP